MLDAPDMASTCCLTDEEVVAFAVGRLEGPRFVAAHAHLDACDVCQRLLSEAAHSLATAATLPLVEQEAVAWNTTFRANDVVGQRYLIRRFIARGGMGEVYEAFDRELQERVALKTVTSTACDNPSAVRRLKGEVQLARRVSHPNVCRIYDFGTHVLAGTGAQISFLTMEFVDGETLRARLRSRGPLPIAEARRLGRQLLLGLSAAHDAGVLHRDFKSDNVMLKNVGGQTCPLILDFGLARAFDHRDGRRAGTLSNAGLIGTLCYLAPEQLEGKPHSTASDIYSLGMVWFEVLTGELPFEDSPSFAVAALERMQKRAPRPSARNSAVPADLDQVVAGCLHRSPKHRFRTTAEVLATLSDLERASRPTKSRMKRWAVAVSACSLALVGFGATHGQAPASGHATVAQNNALLPAVEGQRDAGVPVVSAVGVAPVPEAGALNASPAKRAHPPPIRTTALLAFTSGAADAGGTAKPVIPSSSATPREPRKLDWENPFEPTPAPQSNPSPL